MSQTISLSIEKILHAKDKAQFLSLIDKIKQHNPPNTHQLLLISMIHRLNRQHDEADMMLQDIAKNTKENIEHIYFEQFRQIIDKEEDKSLIIQYGQILLQRFRHNIDILCLFLTYLFHIGYHQQLLEIAFTKQEYFMHDHFASIMRLMAKSFLNCGYPNLYHQWSHMMIARGKLDFIAINDLALHHRDQLRHKEARHYFLHHIKDDSVDGLFIKNRGLNNLLHEYYEEGWQEYNHRFDAEDYSLSYMPFKLPIWQGKDSNEDLNDKKIIVLSEQGYGDNIQLVRLLKQLTINYPHLVIFAVCWQNLKRLFHHNMPNINWIDFPKKQPACDYQIPIFNLPEMMNISATNIPFTQGYLSPPPEYQQKWQKVLMPFQRNNQKNFCLCWHTHNDRTEKNKPRIRSVPLAEFTDLLALPNINFHLISPYINTQEEALLSQYGIIDHRPSIDDFSDSAAIISLCDGVITIDTAMAHLSGALGQKTALILPIINDWRWSLDRQNSIWYNSIHIYRLTQNQHYRDLINRITQDIYCDFFIKYKEYKYNPRGDIVDMLKQNNEDNARNEIIAYIAFLKTYHDRNIAISEIKESIKLLHHICLKNNDPYRFLEVCLDFTREYGIYSDIVTLYLPILYQCQYDELVINLCQEIVFDAPDTACAYWHITGNHIFIINFLTHIDRLCIFKNADYWFAAISYYLTQKNHNICTQFLQHTSLSDSAIKQDILWQYLCDFLKDTQSQEKFYALYCLLQDPKTYSNNPVLYYHVSKLISHIIISHHYHHLPLLPVLLQPIKSPYLWHDYFQCAIKPYHQWQDNDIILLMSHPIEQNILLFNYINILSDNIKLLYIIMNHHYCDDFNKIFGNVKIKYISHAQLRYLNPKPTVLGDIDDIFYHAQTLKNIHHHHFDVTKQPTPIYQLNNDNISLFNIAIFWDNDHYYQYQWSRQPAQYDICDIVAHILQKQLPLRQYINIHLLNPNPSIDERNKILNLQQQHPQQIIDHSLSMGNMSNMLHAANECDVIITIDGTMASILALCDKAMFILHERNSLNVNINHFYNSKNKKDKNYLFIDHLDILQKIFADMYQHNINHIALRMLEKYAEKFVEDNKINIAPVIEGVATKLQQYMNRSQLARFKHIQAVHAQTYGDKKSAYALYQESLSYQETAMCYRNYATMAPEFNNDHDYIASLLQKAIALDDNVPNVYQNLGYQYSDMGRYAESLTCFEKEYEKTGDNRGNLCNLAVAYLKLQYYDQGFAYYRKMRQLFRDDKYKPKTDKPFWQGQDLKNKTLLVQCEQGHGDNLCYSRFIENVKNLGAKVIFVTYANLISLYQDNPMIDQVVLRDEQPLPHHDYWVMVIDLLIDHYHRFKSMTPQAHYLAPHKKRVTIWKKRINKIAPKQTNKLRIGLCWASHNFPIEQRRRALPIDAAKKLINIKNHDLFSLQVGARESDLNEDKAFNKLHNLAPQLFNFEETAVAILQLDLVISVDTAVAHLAGALGKPVWLMLPVGCDWRYLQIDAKDTQNLWYIDLKIFRQKKLNDWSQPIAQIKRALNKLTLES